MQGGVLGDSTASTPSIRTTTTADVARTRSVRSTPRLKPFRVTVSPGYRHLVLLLTADHPRSRGGYPTCAPPRCPRLRQVHPHAGPRPHAQSPPPISMISPASHVTRVHRRAGFQLETQPHWRPRPHATV